MRIVIGCRIPSAGGGVRTYVETIATQLQRTGHDIIVYSPDAGDWTGWFDDRGLRTLRETTKLPEAIDCFLVQDQPTALELLDARPDVPQAFVCHGVVYDVDMAPQLDDAIQVIFSFYGPPVTRVHATSVQPRIVQLRQPIHLSRFSPQGAISERPKRAVSISNYLVGERRQILIDACQLAGIELELYGVNEPQQALSPEHEINSADIVFGKGRVIAEAMSCGRAAYIYDVFGSDGWVTHENFEALVGSGFGGSSTSHTSDARRLAAELGDYERAMGSINRDLALAHFSTNEHIAAIVKELREIAPNAAPHNDQAFELARLSRTSWSFESELHVLRHRMTVVGEEAEHAIQELNERLEQVIASGNLVTQSRRWILLNRLLGPWDRLRGRA